jgi:hypothetical protein
VFDYWRRWSRGRWSRSFDMIIPTATTISTNSFLIKSAYLRQQAQTIREMYNSLIINLSNVQHRRGCITNIIWRSFPIMRKFTMLPFQTRSMSKELTKNPERFKRQ